MIFTSRKEAVQQKIGKPPGALEFVGTPKVSKPFAEIYRYTSGDLTQSRLYHPVDCTDCMDKGQANWMNVIGIHDVKFIHHIAEQFDMHVLQQEALLDTEQRPKYEDLEDGLFIIAKMIQVDEEEDEVRVEQVSFLLKEGVLVSFQEAEQDVFDGVRDRLLKASTRIRQRGTDYLLFALLDSIIDNYLLAAERFGEQIRDLEEELLGDPDEEHLEYIHYYKKELNSLNRHIRPMREVILQLHRDDDAFQDSTRPYLKDLEDHMLQVLDTIDHYRELLSEHRNLYTSVVNNRLNDILRTLTVFSVVFIPLTFLAGVYGMNFKYFPEVDWEYGYPAFWIIEIGLALIMLFYFKRKGWW